VRYTKLAVARIKILKSNYEFFNFFFVIARLYLQFLTLHNYKLGIVKNKVRIK